jgi:hypothetical protein
MAGAEENDDNHDGCIFSFYLDCPIDDQKRNLSVEKPPMEIYP